jgi:hypothetical protein
MKENIESIIRALEKAQELIYKEKYSEANTVIYEAQALAQFIKNNN